MKNQFIHELKEYRGKMPKNVLKTIRGQALNGNLEAAKKGLEKATIKYNAK